VNVPREHATTSWSNELQSLASSSGHPDREEARSKKIRLPVFATGSTREERLSVVVTEGTTSGQQWSATQKFPADLAGKISPED
jgi:hypothetical protein